MNSNAKYPLAVAIWAALSSAGTSQLTFPMSQFTCGYNPPTTVQPTCLTVGMDQLFCSSSQNLPSCIGVSNANVVSLSSLMCPASGTDVLPSCLSLTNDNVIAGTLSPDKIASGTLPSGVTATSANIINGAIKPSALNGPSPEANTLSPNLKISSNQNFVSGISSSKFQAGALPAGVQLSSQNFAANSISISKIAAGPLDSRIKVTNANIPNGTITTDRFSGPENLNPVVTVSAANFDQGSLTADRITCTGSAAKTLGCVTIDPNNLSQTCASNPTNLNTQACIAITGEQVIGDIPASQFSGTISASATMSPASVQCQSTDNPNNVAFPSCMRVDASTQLQCTGTGGYTKPLPCIAIDASQITGTIDSTSANPATVPANKIVGVIESGVTLDGGKVASRTVNADQLPTPDDTNVEDFSPHAIITLTNTGPSADPTSVLNGDVYVCCPKRGIPVQCVYPQIQDTQVTATIFLKSIKDRLILKHQDTVNANTGIDVVYDPINDDPDPEAKSNLCCKFIAPITDYGDPAGFSARFAAICIPGTE